MNSFSDRLRAARIAVGMTQEQLGFALGISKSSVSAWENGRETPSFRFLPRLAQVLAVSLDELLEPPNAPVDEQSSPKPLASRRPPVAKAMRLPPQSDSRSIQTPDELALLQRFRRMPGWQRKALLMLLAPGNEREIVAEE